MLPFLDLTTAVLFSTGSLYWYFWIDSRIKENEKDSYALVCGVLFGLAAWTRIEFLLYDLVPIFLTVYVFSRHPGNNSKSLKWFFLSLLFLPSIWFLNLHSFEMVLWSQLKMVELVCLILWIFFFALIWGNWKFSERNMPMALIFAFVGYFVVLLILGSEPVSAWKKILISLYRTSTVHIFYSFTSLLVIFVFFEKLKALSEQKKLLGCFLILFFCTHLAIFTFATPKWHTLGEFIYATFIQPGNSVNLSDTRGMMSIYPVFVFFIASLPFVKRRFDNE